jgi:hypothetical protein
MGGFVSIDRDDGLRATKIMSALSYEFCRDFLATQLPLWPPGTDLKAMIRQNAAAAQYTEYVDRLIAELVPPDAPSEVVPSSAPTVEPFLLFYLGGSAQAGGHLSPECHVVFDGWDGDVEVEAKLPPTLDQVGWDERPRLRQLLSGSWQFHQTVPLTRNTAPCPPGEYLVAFEIHFRNSPEAPDSSWHGSFKFHVTAQGSSELVIAGDGNSLVNMASTASAASVWKPARTP